MDFSPRTCEKMTPMDEAIIRLHIEWLPEGVFLATSPDVPGLVIQAPTKALAVEYARSGARAIYETLLEIGAPIPLALQNLSPAEQPLDINVVVGVG